MTDDACNCGCSTNPAPKPAVDDACTCGCSCDDTTPDDDKARAHA